MTEAESASAIAFLVTEAGQTLLTETALLPPDRLLRLTRLRRLCSLEIAATAVELLELRHRAKHKFARSAEMFFTGEGLEQSTGDAIARYRASRFPQDGAVLDACCGIGGDAMVLAERGGVLAVDTNPAAVQCAHANTGLLPANRFSSAFLIADVTRCDLPRLRVQGFGAALFDPSRRTDSRDSGRHRVRSPEDYSPSLSFLETLRTHFASVGVKVSPAIDDGVLHAYPEAQVEFLSERGECKEAVLWFGEATETLAHREEILGGENYIATLLTPDAPPAHLHPFPCDLPSLSAPRTWLYEPDPAVIRAHRVPQCATLLKASLLDPQIAYLTADTLSLTPFAVAYPVLDWMPFSLKAVQARLRQLGFRVHAIKKRGVPFEPEDLRKRLMGDPESGTEAIVFLTRHAGRPIALITGLSTSPQKLGMEFMRP